MADGKIFTTNNMLGENGKMPLPVYFENNNWRSAAGLIWMGLLALSVLVLLAVGIGLFDKFASVRSFRSIAKQFLFLAFPAVAVSLVFANGSVDLSVGSVASITGTIMVLLMNAGLGALQAAVIAFMAAYSIGAANGILSGIFRVPGMIVTIVMAFLLRAVNLALLNGMTIPAGTEFPGLNGIAWVLLILLAGGAVIWVQYPGIGFKSARKTLETGNETQYRLLNQGFPWVISALCAAFAGILFLDYLKAATPMGFIGFEVEIIVVLAMSGSCFFSGFGNVGGVLLAAFFLAMMKTLMSILGFNVFLRNIILAILFAGGAFGTYVFHAITGAIYRMQLRKKDI